MNPLHWLIDLWRWQQRRVDLMVLWPTCKREAVNQGLTMEHAKAAFAYHCFHDYAWTYLGEEEIARRIDRLA